MPKRKEPIPRGGSQHFRSIICILIAIALLLPQISLAAASDPAIEIAGLLYDAHTSNLPTMTYTKGYYNTEWRVQAMMRALIPRHINYSVTISGKNVKYQFFYTSPIENRYDEAHTIAKNVVSKYITNKMTNREKIKVLHDWVVLNVSYPSSFVFGDIGTGVSALLNKSAICDGYANAFKMLCDEAGVPCIYVMGWATGVLHAWNMVYDGSKWLNVDTTWDDPARGNSISYDYYLKTASQIAHDHTYGYIPEKDYLNLIKYIYGDKPTVTADSGATGNTGSSEYGEDPRKVDKPPVQQITSYADLCDYYFKYYDPYYSSYYNDYYNNYMNNYYNAYYKKYYADGGKRTDYTVSYVKIGKAPSNAYRNGESKTDYLNRYYKAYLNYYYNEYYYNYYNNYYNELYKRYWADAYDRNKETFTYEDYYSSDNETLLSYYEDSWTDDIDFSISGDGFVDLNKTIHKALR